MRFLLNPPWLSRLPTRWVVGLAMLGPVGHLRPGPGTWGSVVGLAYALGLLWLGCGTLALVAVGLVTGWLAVGLCGEAEKRLGQQDPGGVILDEFVAMPWCFLGWPSLLESGTWWGVGLAGLVLFRLFDITKPGVIGRLQALPGGWGVVADDVAAALATCATLHLWGLGSALWAR